MAGVQGKSGGRRENQPGRPPNAVKYKAKISRATDIMGRMLPEAAQATVDLAIGLYVLMISDGLGGFVPPRTEAQVQAALKGGPALYRVYRQAPDIRAIQVMFERVAGKVPQPLDVRHQLAVEKITEAQTILMRVLEEHVPGEYLPAIRAELARVADLHSDARTAVGVPG